VKGEFFPEQDLTFEQVKALTGAMLTVARVDGVHDNEMKLVREFYESCTRAGDPRLEEVAGDRFEPEHAKALFNTPELARMFVKSLILLAFADGRFAKSEEDLIRSYAEALGLKRDDLERLKDATKEYLMGGLVHVQNLDALKDVSKRLSH
jgi:tellurite resistance protein TerB